MTAIAMAVLFIPSAFAVHDTGYFALDGDASSTGTALPDDWDRVCHQVTGNANCGTTTDTHQQSLPGTPFGSNAVAWTGDCPLGQKGYGCVNNNATIFTGGGSKDPGDINGWAWKDGAGGLPDKDNLVHAFAARYSIQGTNKDGTCPNGTDLPPPIGNNSFVSSVNCQVIFFGSDRFDNSGDAQQGFWFMQNAIGLGANSVGGGSGFTSSGSASTPATWHRNGDVLVISDFSNGGGTSTITVYRWDTTCTKAATKPVAGDCGDANLRLLLTSDNALCGGNGVSNDAACGIVNATNGTTSPWSGDYTDKSGNHSYLQGELFEAGINLSTLGLAGECFSSVLSETRSSTSTTATLKDFVLSGFAPCGANIQTAPSAGTGANPVSPGTQVRDVATVTGSGISNPPFPSSPPNVTFYLCNPATVTANGGDCRTGGAATGTTKALVASATQGVSTATSDYVNTSGSPLAPGTYCFRAEWPGDGNYPGLIKDGSSGECFTVRTIPASPVTTPWSASGSTGHALGTGTLALGTMLFDKAVVTGTDAGGAPPGSVQFYLCDPSHLDPSTAGSEACATGGIDLGTGALTADSGSPSPPTSTAFSTGTVANKAGVWCFRAVYVPTGSTYTAGDADASHTECVTVGPEATTTVTNPLPGIGPLAVGTHVTDHAVVTAHDNVDGTPTGTVTFYVCTPVQVTPDAANGNLPHCNPADGSTVGTVQTATAVASSNPPASEATSSTFVNANVVGTWCFAAVYAPGGANGANYSGSSDSTNDECFLVQDSTSMSSTQSWVPNDSATVAVTGGTHLNGTLSIQMYTGTCLANQTDVASGATAVGSAYTKPLSDASSPADLTLATTNSTAYSTTTTIAWLVKFTPTAGSNVTGSQHCEQSTVNGFIN